MGDSDLPLLVQIVWISPIWRSLDRHFRFKGLYKRLATEPSKRVTL